ncbi:MAG: sodium:solute symporter family protein [Myxococcota bacterium]|nr:sodium:solute symporter family protein [Myxococcota bacterium]
MDVQTWTFLIVGFTFTLYVGIAIWSRASSTKEFYVAGGGVHPVANGMATAADWMSAASFISMAGLISFMGYDGSVYLMGWTGGYVLLALLLAPYLRKFGKFTVPDFVGDRYYSNTARVVAVLCAIFISFTYVAGQMRGVGVVFSRFLEVDITTGVIIGMGLVLFYAVLGGMKGITYTQVAQYVILIFAFMVPAIFISIMLTNNPIPQLGFGGNLGGDIGSRIAGGQSVALLEKLNGLHAELGFEAYTSGSKSKLDVFCIAAALMVGTAGLPHVIVRFYTVPKVRDARISAGWALLFIAILYTTAPAVAAFARTNLIDTVQNAHYTQHETEKSIPDWFHNWENTGLLAWVDKNEDGKIQYYSGKPFVGKPKFIEADKRGIHGQRLLENKPTESQNELYIDRDIMVLANPEIAQLPAWVIALVAAGALAAALSTAAGLLLVVSTAISHDLLKRTLRPDITEKQELWAARIAASFAVLVAGYFGINPPGFVAQVVAFAFGLAASTFFPAILLGIFTRWANREGVITGMLSGLIFTSSYIVYFKFLGGTSEQWLFGISPEGIGTLGMVLNFVVAMIVSKRTAPPPQEIQDLVESIRIPKGSAGPSVHD